MLTGVNLRGSACLLCGLLLSTQVRSYADVFPFVGRTPSSARDAAVLMKNAPPKPARGPAAVQGAVQGDRPTWQSSAPDSSLWLRRTS
jgi:hypothetical protein